MCGIIGPRPSLSSSVLPACAPLPGKTGTKGTWTWTWTCASGVKREGKGEKNKREKEKEGRRGWKRFVSLTSAAVVVVDRVSFSGGRGREGGEGICIHCVGWTPARHNKNLGSRRRDILATHVPLAGIASVRRFFSSVAAIGNEKVCLVWVKWFSLVQWSFFFFSPDSKKKKEEEEE